MNDLTEKIEKSTNVKQQVADIVFEQAISAQDPKDDENSTERKRKRGNEPPKLTIDQKSWIIVQGFDLNILNQLMKFIYSFYSNVSRFSCIYKPVLFNKSLKRQN